MQTKDVTITDIWKKYDNPAGKLVQISCGYESKIMLERENMKINAKSLMGIMAFSFNPGDSLRIITDGTDEDKASMAIADFLCE